MKRNPKRLAVFLFFLLSITAIVTLLHFRRYISVKAQDWLYGTQLGVRLEEI